VVDGINPVAVLKKGPVAEGALMVFVGRLISSGVAVVFQIIPLECNGIVPGTTVPLTLAVLRLQVTELVVTEGGVPVGTKSNSIEVTLMLPDNVNFIKVPAAITEEGVTVMIPQVLDVVIDELLVCEIFV
jgi:hypothetical protein